MTQYPSRIEALRMAVESRSWAMVEIAVDALDQSLTKLVDGLVGPSSCLDECSEMHTFTYPCSQALKPEGDRKRGPYTYDVEPQAGEKVQGPTAFWRDHYKDMGDEQYRNRFQHEMDVLREHGAAGYLTMLTDIQESRSDVHIGTCQIREAGTCTCSEEVGEPTAPVPGSAMPRVTDWGPYDECEYCEVPPGHPCIYTVGSPFHNAVNTRKYPHPSRNLISHKKESDSRLVDNKTHSTPPVPTRPHTANQLPPPCDHAIYLGDGWSTCPNATETPWTCPDQRAPLTSESTASCTSMRPGELSQQYQCVLPAGHTKDHVDQWWVTWQDYIKSTAHKKKLCYRGNACMNPGHSAVANCIMGVKEAQDPAKQKAAIEEDARQTKIVHEQFAKRGILTHWGHTDPCDAPVCNVCPWCDETLAYDKIHEHTVEHNRNAGSGKVAIGERP